MDSISARVLVRTPRWTPGDDDLISGLVSASPSTPCPASAGCACPFHGPPFGLSVLIPGLDVNERVRVAVHKLHQSAFEPDFHVGPVGGAYGMMSVRRRARQQQSGNHE